MPRRTNENGTVYDVYLTTIDGLPWVESPDTVYELEFDDYGAWLSRDETPGRDFYPYHQIRLVREGPAPDVGDDEGSAER